MNRIFSLLLLGFFFFSGCKTSRFIKLMQLGGVSQNEFVETINFDYQRRLIFIEAEINGIPRRFMLDTGAPNVITKQLQEELGLPSVFRQKITDSQNESAVQEFVVLDSVKLGNVKFNETIAVVLEWDKSIELQCLGIDGLIGANLMRNAFWQIDFQEQQLTLTNEYKNLIIPEGADTMVFKAKLQGTPYVSAKIGEETSSRITVDSGSSGEISLGLDRFRELTQQPRIKSYGYLSAGVYGSQIDTSYSMFVDSLQLGGLWLEKEWIELEDNASDLVGNIFWEQFLMTINWESNQILLNRRKERELDLKHYGFAAKFRNNQLYVGVLHEGFAPERADIEIGDVILELNGVSVKNIDQESYCSQFISGTVLPKTDTLEIRIQKQNTNEVLELSLPRIHILEKL